MVADPVWLLELTRQVHGRRFIASGGVLKHVLREHKETEKDLLCAGESEQNGTVEMAGMAFRWLRHEERYKRER
jgi:hypothetical protein